MTAICAAFDEIAKLAIRLHVAPINGIAGCWEYKVDAQWWIAVNPHNTPTKCSRGAVIEPFNCFVEFNGWPAGSFSPAGGAIAAGELANEDSFIAALRAAGHPR
jgi:hypothetical protein